MILDIKKILPYIFIPLFLTACSSPSSAKQKLISSADQDYFLGLKLLDQNKENEAKIKFQNCIDNGTYYCARKSAECLTRIGSVQDKNIACEKLVKMYDDSEAKLTAAQQFSSAGEIKKLIELTNNLNLKEEDNELVNFRMTALMEKNDSHLLNELLEWFSCRQISTYHYKYYRDQLKSLFEEQLSITDNNNQTNGETNSNLKFSQEFIDFITYRIDLYKRDFNKTFDNSKTILDYLEKSKLEAYPLLISDLGKAYLYGNDKFLENAGLFEKLAKQYKDSPAEFYFWFYAARLYVRTEKNNQDAIKCYENAIACTTNPNQKDNALWYLLDVKINDSYKSTINSLSSYASQWADPDYFDDFFDSLIMQLTVSGDWEAFPVLFEQVKDYASKEATAKIAYICGRLIQTNNIKVNNGDRQEQINHYFSVACSSGFSTYYKLLAAYELNLSEKEIASIICSPITDAKIEIDAAAESLLKGYAQFGFPEKVYPEWQKIYKKGVSTDVSMFLADFLYKCAKHDSKYVTLSIRIAARAANISDRLLTKDELKLVYPIFYTEHVEKYCKKFNLNPSVIYALIRSESFFDADVESSAGAIGLTQLMQLTSDDIARKFQIEEYSLTDPETNIKFGTYYLSELYQRCDNTILQAFFSYNAGITRVRRWLNSSMIGFGEKKNMPGDLFLETVPYAETREYGRKLISASIMYKWLYGSKTPYKEIVKELLY